MNILVTAGPTREFLDDVRYLSNASSGLMGCALAQAAVDAGHNVTLICGPITCELPACDTLVPITSAAEMARAVREQAPQADVVIMAAAVADYTPAERAPGKMKKTDGERVLRLKRTTDILAELGGDKGERTLVGFALEADNARGNAIRKLREKNLDLIIANSPAAMGAGHSAVELIFASGQTETLADAPKTEIATHIIRAIESLKQREP
jgi:phosphopantothenoylcysteine decarboxylase/phosphopantothenate--cysteine ligase